MFQKLKYFIKHNGNQYQLKHAPKEWDEATLNWKRSTDYFGLSREFSFPNEFVKDGANILRRIYYRNSTEAEASLEIHRFQSLEQGYTNEYRGEFDFSTFLDYGDMIQIDMADNGIAADIKANETTNHEFSQDEADCFVRISNADEVRKAEGNVFSAQNFEKDIASPSIMIADSDEMQDTVLEVQDQNEQGYDELFELMADDNYFLKANQDRNINIRFSFRITNYEKPDLGPYPKFMIYDDNQSIVYEKQINSTGTHTYELNLLIEEGRKYFAVFTPFRIKTGDVFDPIETKNLEVYGDESIIEINYSRGGISYDVPAIRASTLFDKLIQKIRGKSTETQSSLLEEFDNIKITCGDWIRFMENSDTRVRDPKMITNFKDFFTSLHSTIGACMGLDGDIVRLENYEYFFNPLLKIGELGEITEPEIRPATEFMGTGIKVGYKDQSYDIKLGRYEYNSEQQFTTGIKRVSGNIDFLSPYRADFFGIDKIRLEVEDDNVSKKDKEADKDVWMVWTQSGEIDEDLYLAETAADFDNVEGIKGMQAPINLRISPKRNLMRNLPFLKSIGHHTPGMFFESGKKNTDLKAGYQGSYIEENKDLLFDAHPNAQALFIPIEFTMVSPITYNQLIAIHNKNKGYFEFNYNGHTLKGFIMKVEANITFTDDVEVKLLLHPDTDLNKLIN